MHFVVLIFALFMVITGAIILIKPLAISGVMGKYSSSFALHVLAVVVRLLLGGILLLAAPASKFPLTLEVIGWVSILAGIALALIGHRRFVRLVEWGMTALPEYRYIIGTIGILFGIFLGYAVV